MALASKADTKWVTFTMKEELETACLEESEQCFTQATKTPMLQLPMIDLLGVADMDSLAFKQILDRRFDCPLECNPYLQKLFPYLARPANIPEVSMQTYEEYKNSWEKAQETTASFAVDYSLWPLHCGNSK